MRKSFYALLCALLMCCAFLFVACGEEETPTTVTSGEETPTEHTHSYAAATCTTPKTCSCGATEGEPIAHSPVATPAKAATCTAAGCEDDGEVCSVCGTVTKEATVIPKLGHDYVDVLDKDATCLEQGYVASSGVKVCERCGSYSGGEPEIIRPLGHIDENEDGTCDRVDCGLPYCDGIDHVYDEDTFVHDNNSHWNEALCGCDEKINEETHIYDDYNVCEVCGYNCKTEGHEHEYTGIWVYTNANHWQKPICGHDTERYGYGAHVDSNGDKACDTCGKNMADIYDVTAKYNQYNWDITQIYVCLNENSNDQELSSELRRYLAGDTTKKESIDVDVARRNALAEATTRVKVQYIYWGEGDTLDKTAEGESAKWSESITRMKKTVETNAPKAPDIYVNQIYDMVAATLQGCFANILATGVEGRDNYFSFVDPEFNEYRNATSSDGKGTDGEEWGYMMEYMSELGFSTKKQYLIASDYFIDLVRAFFVVPMNLNLLGQIDKNAVAVYDKPADRNDDGKFNVDDFYSMVMDGEWTYDTLIAYSNAIFSNTSQNPNGSMDDINGFILTPSNGMISSALLYTTSVKIFDRVLDEETGFYSCSYPDKNEELDAFCKKLAEMVAADGVYVERVDHLDVRAKFTSNQVLFGGIILLGSLEYQAYQEMKEGDGFGILPVPVYRYGDSYLTMIHNMGRIAAIAANSGEFTQCTAYLDYQSTHSTDILNNYYEYKLEYDMAGGTAGNIYILEYIRENVRSAFDKTYDDAIGNYVGNNESSSWAGIISKADFSETTMRDKYETNKNARVAAFNKIIEQYANLP